MDLYYILALIQGFILGWTLCKLVINYRVRKALSVIAESNGMTLDQMTNVITNQEVLEVPNLFTEVMEHSIMLYNKDTNQFVCQGHNIDELAQTLMNHNKIEVALVNHNNEKVWFVEGKVRKNLKEIE